MTASWLKEQVKKKQKPSAVKTSELLSTGSTLLNLAISGKRNGGFPPGHVLLFVGDSQAGKSWLAKTIMAEACKNLFYSNYRLIDDNPERGTLMDIPRYFGKTLAGRLEKPNSKGHSVTSEDFYDNVDDAVREGKPFIYTLDSEDALQPESAIKKASKNKNSRRKPQENGEEVKGSYGTEKAKINSSGLRAAHNGLEDTKSILIIIKQTRENIGFGAIFNPKTRSGGKALSFYCSIEVWFSIKGKIKKTVRGKARVVGTILRIHVKKNRVSGRDRTVEIPFFVDFGLDDLLSCVNYLIEEKHWTGKENSVTAPEFDFSGSKDKLIALIEEGNREKELRSLTERVWNQIEQEMTVKRKPRYV